MTEFAKKSIVELEIYVDEIEPANSCNYIILGALFVPCNNKEKIFSRLLNVRCLNTKNDEWNGTFDSCPNNVNCRVDLHKMNNVEIHFYDIKDSRVNSSLINISKSWINQFCNNNQKYFANVLYINLDNLDTSFFGDENKKANIYNKFFRTVINYGLKCFFGSYDQIDIKNIFYDKKTDLEIHYFFNNMNLDKIIYESSKNIEFKNKIIFIDSDHKIENDFSKESHFIQLIDLIIGSIRHNIFRTSKSKNKIKVAKILRPLLNNIQAQYWCSPILKVSFFPKNKIETVNDLNNAMADIRNDEYEHLDCFKFKMPAQETTLEAWS